MMNPTHWYHFIISFALLSIVVSLVMILLKYLKHLKRCDEHLDSLDDLNQETIPETTICYLLALNTRLSKQFNISEPIIKIVQDLDPNASAFKTTKGSFITFSDSLFDSLPKESIGSILAHEINHIKEKHFFKESIISMSTSLIWNILGTLPMFLLYSNADISYIQATPKEVLGNLLFTFYYFLCVAFLQVPVIQIISLFFSRKNEIESDLFAIKYTSPDYFLTQAMYFHNLDPDFYQKQKLHQKLFNSHPSWEKRMSLVSSNTHGMKPTQQTFLNKIAFIKKPW